MSNSLPPHGLQRIRLPCPHYLPEFVQILSIESMMLSNDIILCCPLLLLLSTFTNIKGLFKWVSPPPQKKSALYIRWPNIRDTASASVLSMNIKGWFPLELTSLILQSMGLYSLLRHHNSKASVLWCSAFFMIQLSHLYMTTRKTIALTIRTFVGKVMSLLFNMLARFAIAFLPRSKCLLISQLQLPSAVILEPKKIKTLTVSIFFPSIRH